MLSIAVGTTSEQKIGYLKEILKELNVDAQIFSCEVKSLVSEQPLTSQETKQGSINRAKHAFELMKEDGKSVDFAMGIEVGYEMNEKGNYEIFCWTSIVDGEGNTVSGQSSNFLMPKLFQKVIKENKYVYHYLEEYMAAHTDAVEKAVGEMINNRKPFIVDATRKALMYHLKKEDFKE
jgi:non-canonical (house-cleaning) NTP pyrophosphatase